MPFIPFAALTALITDRMDDDDTADYYLSERNSSTVAEHEGLGLVIEGDGVVLTGNALADVRELANRVIHEYDNGDGNDPTWDALNLRTDDDCDYAGGYIIIFLDLCVRWLENNP